MDKLKANFMVEIIGRPAEHIKEGLNTLVVKMGSEQGVAIIDKEYHNPKKVEKEDNLWSCFANVDVEFDSLEIFFDVCMSYMPSHVEIYEPEKFKFDIGKLNVFSNHLLSRIHNYNAIATRLVSEKDILAKEVQRLKDNPLTVSFGDEEGKKTETKAKKEKKKAEEIKKK
jgi:hypothetical protein